MGMGDYKYYGAVAVGSRVFFSPQAPAGIGVLNLAPWLSL
jgi:hypothetical protein